MLLPSHSAQAVHSDLTSDSTAAVNANVPTTMAMHMTALAVHRVSGGDDACICTWLGWRSVMAGVDGEQLAS